MKMDQPLQSTPTLEMDGAAGVVDTHALVQTHHQAVFRLALSILDDPAEAEEAMQDTFLAAIKALEGGRAAYRGEASLKTWLFSIAINLCRRRLRKRKARELLSHTLQSLFRLTGEGPTHPEELVIQSEAKSELWKAVEALGEKHRLPLVLHYEHELSVAEIAQALNLRPGTVLSRLYTGRERLRQRLAGDVFGEAGTHESD